MAEPSGLQGVPTTELCKRCQGLLGGSKTKGWAQQLLGTSGFNFSLKPRLSFGHQTTSLSSLQRTNPVAELILPRPYPALSCRKKVSQNPGLSSSHGRDFGEDSSSQLTGSCSSLSLEVL